MIIKSLKEGARIQETEVLSGFLPLHVAQSRGKHNRLCSQTSLRLDKTADSIIMQRERVIMKTNYVLENLYESKENILKLNTSSDMKEFQGDAKTPFSHGKEQYNYLNLSCYKPTLLSTGRTKIRGATVYMITIGESREMTSSVCCCSYTVQPQAAAGHGPGNIT